MTSRMVRLAGSIVVAIVSAASATTARGGYAELILHSAPGSYIGGGQNYDIINNNVNPFNVYPSDNLPDGELTNIQFNVFQSGTVFAAATFSTHMLGIALQPGAYNNAERFPFEVAGHPGLDVTFYDEGSNTLTGSFTITNATFFKDSSGNYEVQSFAATFDQTSDNNTSHVTGSITYSAVPEPTSIALALCGVGLAAGMQAARRRRPA